MRKASARSTNFNAPILIAAGSLIFISCCHLVGCTPPHTGSGANATTAPLSRVLQQALACPPGHGSVIGGPPCAPCPPGYFSRGGAGSKCAVCDQNSYAPSYGSAACTACPANQWVGFKGSAQAICVCVKDFYFAFYREASLKKQGLPSRAEIDQTLGTFSAPSESFCIPCPDGASCAGSYDFPRPTPGYWANQSDPVSIVFCTWNKDACLGNFSCLPHHSGPLCGRCEQNFFMRSGTCSKCSLSSRIIILYIILLGIGGGAVFAWLVKVQSTFVIISSVQYFQVLTILNRVGITWPDNLAIIFETIQAINFNPSVLQLECDNSGVDNDYQNFIIMMLIGITVTIVIFFSFIVNAIMLYRKEVGVTRKELLIESVHSHLYKILAFHDLVFMPFTIRIIEVLTCRATPDGSLYMLSTPTVDCSADIYQSSFVPLAAFSAVWYIGFYLIAYCAVFMHCRAHVEDNLYAMSYGKWWVRYKPRYFWWQLVFTTRKFFLALCIGLLPEKPIYQMISSMSIWILIMMLHFYIRPYRSKFMDRLDDILLVFMLSIFIACAHFKLDQDSNSVMYESDIDRFSYFVLGTMGVSALFLSFFVGQEVLIGTYNLRLKNSAEFMNHEPRGVPIRDPSKITEMVKNLQQTGVISSVTEDWLTFKADNTQRFHMQNAMQDLADFMFKEDSKKSKDPQSWSTIGFEQNTSAHIFRFITEIGQRDRELLHNFLAGCRRMNLEHDYVFASCNPCLLADLMVSASDDLVYHIRKSMLALQAYHIKEMANFSKESLAVAAKESNFIAQNVASSTSPQRSGEKNGNMLASGGSVHQFSAGTVGRNGNRATISQSPASAQSLNQSTSKQLLGASASTVITTPPSNVDTGKFGYILNWTKIPTAPKMLPEFKARLSQQAAATYRSFDKDSNGILSTVEFFEGMMGSSMGLLRDQVIHLLKIQAPLQSGFVSFQEFERMYMAIQSNEEVAALQLSILEPIDDDDDICIISESPSPDRTFSNPSALTKENAEALRSKIESLDSALRQRLHQSSL